MAFLPAVAAIASVAGTALGTISQVNAANYRAKVAQNNAKAANQNAVYSAKASSARVEQEGLKTAQRLSGVEAGIAANNIDTGTGSAADVQQSQHALGMNDTATVANEGALKVYGYETEASGFQAQAKADKAEVLPDILGGVFKAVGQVASHAGDLGIGGGGGGGFDSGAAFDSAFSGLGHTEVTEPTLAEGAPSVPSNYQWMRNSSYDPDRPNDLELGY